MRSRQYILSLAASAAAAGVLLSGILLFLRWTGCLGALGIAAAVGIFIAWFYGGPRPDLAVKDGGEHRHGSASE